MTPLCERPYGLSITVRHRSNDHHDVYRLPHHQALPELIITRRWRAPGAFVFFGFAVMWLTTFVVCFLTAGWILPLVLFGAAGVVVLYSAIAGLINVTTISIQDGFFTVRHGPLPVRKPRTLPLSHLKHIAIARRASPMNGVTYAVHAIGTDRTDPRLTLADDLIDPEQASFLQRTIERHVGLLAR